MGGGLTLTPAPRMRHCSWPTCLQDKVGRASVGSLLGKAGGAGPALLFIRQYYNNEENFSHDERH